MDFINCTPPRGFNRAEDGDEWNFLGGAAEKSTPPATMKGVGEQQKNELVDFYLMRDEETAFLEDVTHKGNIVGEFMPPKMILETSARARPTVNSHNEDEENSALDYFHNRAISISPAEVIAELASLVDNDKLLHVAMLQANVDPGLPEQVQNLLQQILPFSVSLTCVIWKENEGLS